MMDFHILIVIACVFLASLFSLLLINKFFKRKTFEEIIAEKKAMTEKIYGQNKSTAKRPKKLQQLKKEQKREKKQRQKEQQRDNTEKEQEAESDVPSEHTSLEDEPPVGLSKTHVEFEPEPEIVTYTSNVESASLRRASNADKENVVANPPIKQTKSKKDKKSGKSGILINKNEPVCVKESPIDESLNNFESNQPKDVVELKKIEKENKPKEVKEEKPVQQQQIQQQPEKSTHVKKEKTNKKDKQVDQPAELVTIAKELKQLDEKFVRQGSPKNTNKVSAKTKKQNKDTAATKELVVSLDKLSENDSIGVSLLMNLFRRAELNRSEIQILIDYLLNKQQDMPSSHSEWSDDICQKLKRQLEEKERLLVEEQEASLGIQAKLRDLRTEINTERAQMNANVKAYIEKIQSKEQELSAVNQELQALNDKVALERQQFQAKLLREKQAGSQELLAQLQMMQNELAHKDKCISELTCVMNASHQAVEDSQQKTSELIQTQVQQIRALEQQRDELEQISNNRVFEIEQAKTMECENAENKVEILNLQNALESTKADLAQVRKELEAITVELDRVCNVVLVEKETEIEELQAKNFELAKQITALSSKSEEDFKEQSDLAAVLEALRVEVEEKEQELQAYHLRNTELKRELTEAQSEWAQRDQEQNELKVSIDVLMTESAEKDKKLAEAEQAANSFTLKEKELLQQLHEQKEKNNELRTKNWKLVEALQIAENTAKQNKLSNEKVLVQQEHLLAAAQKSISTATATTDPPKDQQQIRELFQRLYPDAVEACAGTALTLSFDQWIEQVVATHIKKSTATTTSSSNKSTQSNNSTSSNHSQTNESSSPHGNSELEPAEQNVDRGGSGDGDDSAEVQKLRLQNAQLRANIDELTNLVKKTGNTLSDLENRSREQDENWRIIVRSKEEEINSLQHSNGEQDI